MKRILVRAATPAVVFVLGGVASTVSFFGGGCLPTPDISGLPAYEGGTSATGDSGAIVIPDGSTSGDSTISFEGGGGSEAGSGGDSAPSLGNIVGVVVDYTQGNGQGVLPGAKVSVVVAGSTTAIPVTTTDVNGAFSISNVPAGTAQISVTKATDIAKGIAYSSTGLVATVAGGQTLNVFPVLHEGCFQPVNVNEDSGATGTASLSTACGRTGAWAQMTFDPTAFVNPINGSLYSGSVRVEMIPLAYPVTGSAEDLSWALGLPGKASPLDIAGAAEYRVIAVDPGGPDDGLALGIRTAIPSPVSVSVPMYFTPPATPTASTYDPTSGQWTAQPNVIPGQTQTQTNPGPITLTYVNMPVPTLGWWAATTPATTTGCITGTVQSSGTGVQGVFVHAYGTNGLSSATTTTGPNGAFCLDVQSTPDSGVASVSVTAGYVSSGVAFTTPNGGVLANLSGLATGSCASGTGCTVMSAPINLTSSFTCVSGTLSSDAGAGSDASPALPSTLNVVSENISGVQSAAASAGVKTTAYLGQITLGAGAAFCALAPAGSRIQLQDPLGTGCLAPWLDGTSSTQPVPSGANDPVCASCTGAVGLVQYGCPAP